MSVSSGPVSYELNSSGLVNTNMHMQQVGNSSRLYPASNIDREVEHATVLGLEAGA